jgi:hypothetical protein
MESIVHVRIKSGKFEKVLECLFQEEGKCIQYIPDVMILEINPSSTKYKEMQLQNQH